MMQIAPKSKTTFVGAHVDREQREQVLALARSEDRSVSAIVRRALRRELELADAKEATT